MSHSSSIDNLLDALWSNKPLPKQYESIPSPSRSVEDFRTPPIEDDLHSDELFFEE